MMFCSRIERMASNFSTSVSIVISSLSERKVKLAPRVSACCLIASIVSLQNLTAFMCVGSS